MDVSSLVHMIYCRQFESLARCASIHRARWLLMTRLIFLASNRGLWEDCRQVTRMTKLVLIEALSGTLVTALVTSLHHTLALILTATCELHPIFEKRKSRE